MDRAGRMAATHTKPDKTWQLLPIVFIRSYKSLARARKNVKLILKGEEAGDDKTTDYDKPRKRTTTDRFRITEDGDQIKIKKPKSKRTSKRASQFSDSSDENDSEVPQPQTNLQELQNKLSKALALRNVLPKSKGKLVIQVASNVPKIRAPVGNKPASTSVARNQDLKKGPCHAGSSQYVPTASSSTLKKTNFATQIPSKDDFGIGSINPPSPPQRRPLVNHNSVLVGTTPASTSVAKGQGIRKPVCSAQGSAGSSPSVPTASSFTLRETSSATPTPSKDDFGVGSIHSPSPPQRGTIVDYHSDISDSDLDSNSSNHFSTFKYHDMDYESDINTPNAFGGNETTPPSTPSHPPIKIAGTQTQHTQCSPERKSYSSKNSCHLLEFYQQGEELKRLVKQVLTNQRRILSYIVPEGELTVNDFDELPNLPLKTEDDWDEFEQYLDLKSQKREVVKFMTALHSMDQDEGKFVSKVLPQIVSNSLARCISWKGTEGTKIAFRTSKCNNALRLAVLKVFPSSNLLKAEAKIQRWFNTSAQRH